MKLCKVLLGLFIGITLQSYSNKDLDYINAGFSVTYHPRIIILYPATWQDSTGVDTLAYALRLYYRDSTTTDLNPIYMYIRNPTAGMVKGINIKIDTVGSGGHYGLYVDADTGAYLLGHFRLGGKGFYGTECADTQTFYGKAIFLCGTGSDSLKPATGDSIYVMAPMHFSEQKIDSTENPPGVWTYDTTWVKGVIEHIRWAEIDTIAGQDDTLWIESNVLISDNAKVTGYVSTDSLYRLRGYNFIHDRGGLENTFMGRYAGSSITGKTGYSNVGIGYLALSFDTTGNENTAVGARSLSYNRTGTGNTALGCYSLFYNLVGNNNTGIGSHALLNNLGNNNTGVGMGALQNSVGEGNCAFGVNALSSNILLGDENTGIGTNALAMDSIGMRNVGLGAYSGYSNITGNNNVFLGDSAGYYETSSNKLYIENSSSSTPLIWGDFANDSLRFNGTVNWTVANDTVLYATTSGGVTGDSVTASARSWLLGGQALAYTLNDSIIRRGRYTVIFDGSGALKCSTLTYYADTAGYALNSDNLDGYHSYNFLDTSATAQTKQGYLDVNSSINTDSLYRIGGIPVLSVAGNTFVGSSAGYTGGGGGNTFLGYQSGYSNSGGGNTFLGDCSGYSNAASNFSTFLGYQSGYKNTSGYNTFLGSLSGYSNTTGGGNTFVGCQSGYTNISSSSNTFLGYQTGYNTTAGDNTFLGFHSGFSNTTGNSNTFLGCQSGFSNTTGNGNTFLGSSAGYSETGSNKLYIDNSNTATPLIWGDFENDSIKINGTLKVTGNIVGGQTIWSENLSDIMKSGFLDSTYFVTAVGVDTGFFSIGLPYTRYGKVQVLDSLQLFGNFTRMTLFSNYTVLVNKTYSVRLITPHTDSLRKAYLVVADSLGATTFVDSFTTTTATPSGKFTSFKYFVK